MDAFDILFWIVFVVVLVWGVKHRRNVSKDDEDIIFHRQGSKVVLGHNPIYSSFIDNLWHRSDE